MNGRFAILNIISYPQIDGIIITCETDCPCRLTMRYTHLKPSKHLEPVLRRGLEMHSDPRFCFTRISEIEQQEDGDTLIHSFWPKGLDYWKRFHCYLYGTIGGTDSPSTSPIMEFENTFRRYRHTWNERGLAEVGKALSYNSPLAMNFKTWVPSNKWCVQIYLYFFDPKYTFSVHFYKSPGAGAPTGDPIASQYFYSSPYKRLFPNKGMFCFDLRPFTLVPDWLYSIVIYGDPLYPDTDVFWWSSSPDEYAYHDERAWRGTNINGAYGWVKYPDEVLHYELWRPR